MQSEAIHVVIGIIFALLVVGAGFQILHPNTYLLQEQAGQPEIRAVRAPHYESEESEILGPATVTIFAGLSAFAVLSLTKKKL